MRRHTRDEQGCEARKIPDVNHRRSGCWPQRGDSYQHVRPSVWVPQTWAGTREPLQHTRRTPKIQTPFVWNWHSIRFLPDRNRGNTHGPPWIQEYLQRYYRLWKNSEETWWEPPWRTGTAPATWRAPEQREMRLLKEWDQVLWTDFLR